MAVSIVARRGIVVAALLGVAASLGGCGSSELFEVEFKCPKRTDQERRDELIALEGGAAAQKIYKKYNDQPVVLGGASCAGGPSGPLGPPAEEGDARTAGALEFFDQASGKFLPASQEPFSVAGAGAVVTRLTVGPLAGKLLVTGGLVGRARVRKDELDPRAPEASDLAVLIDPEKHEVRPVGSIAVGSFAGGRVFHTATELPDGKVLVAGGSDAAMAPIGPAVLFDPRSGSATLTINDMRSPRYLHTATRLPDGRVLFAGGIGANATTLSVGELYSPQTGAFSGGDLLLGRMKTPDGKDAPLAGHSATLIEGCGCDADGKILIAGGFSGSGVTTGSRAVMLFDPETRTFEAKGVAQLTDARLFHTATLVGGGRVVFAGGMFGQASIMSGISGILGGVRQSAELFDPRKGSLACVGGTTGRGEKKACRPSMFNGRAAHTATRFSSGPLKGRVLIAGGVGARKTARGEVTILDSAEVFDPDALTFEKTGSMRTARAFAAAP